MPNPDCRLLTHAEMEEIREMVRFGDEDVWACSPTPPAPLPFTPYPVTIGFVVTFGLVRGEWHAFTRDLNGADIFMVGTSPRDALKNLLQEYGEEIEMLPKGGAS